MFRDLFFTILVIWILWRIFSGTRVFFTTMKNNPGPNQAPPENKKEGETTISYNSTEKKQRKKDPGGEYVDYEEIK